MLYEDADLLHIPEVINFDCTGCGNCCLQWPVPATADERQRIIDLSRELNLESKGQLFRRVEADVIKNKSQRFQYTLEKKSDGRCIFLTDLNRCALHEQFGAQAKPGMCQLFPYTFTEAPDGFYASVSFASSGVLFNQGKALVDQRQHLSEQLALFQQLFPQLSLDWSKIQLADGLPIRWSHYLLIERDILSSLKKNIEESTAQDQFDWSIVLLAISDLIASKVPADEDLERKNLIPSTNFTDLLLIRYLLHLYFPVDVFSDETEQPSIRALIEEFTQEKLDSPNVVSYSIGEFSPSLAEICAIELTGLDKQSENLFARYIYARIFSKLYFGAGMAHFSLLSGYHHLVILIALMRIKLKTMVWLQLKQNPDQEIKPIDHLQVAEIVRSLERKLASFQHTTESATILQVLLESPSRFKRLMSLAI